MTVDIITPFKMQWLDGFKKVFPGCEISKEASIWNEDIVNLFMWCDKSTVEYINNAEYEFKNQRHIVFIRRYEMYTPWIEQMDWSKVDAVIMVNMYLAKKFEQRTGVKPYVIYNGVLAENWRFKERKHGKKIAMVGYINQKKNYPLALQILAKLPEGYELHLAGEVQCQATMDYIDNLAKRMKRQVIYNGRIDNIDFWLEDKNYLLSTAISEGNPNNVIEAMAKGIKPVVHDWPGADSQFHGNVFNTVDEAIVLMSPESRYDSKSYRMKVEEKFGYENFIKIRNIVNNISRKVA